MIPLLACASVLLAVPGLVLLRSGPLPARVLALLAMLVLAVVSLDPPATVLREVPARVAIAATDPAAALPAALATAEVVRPAAGAGEPFAVRLAGAALAAGPRADELIALWNGPAPLPSDSAIAMGRARTTVPALPFSPEDLRVGCQQPLAAGRPAFLEVTAGRGQAVAARLVVRDGADVVADVAVAIPPDRAAEVPLWPKTAGALVVELVAEHAGHTVRRAGRLPVAAPPRVLVLDPSGNAAAALRAQGVPVEVVDSLPPDLGPFAAAVLGSPVAASAQARLAAAVDAGLGLFVLGPALPRPAEPLEQIVPIRPVAARGSDAGVAAAPGPGPTPPPSRPPSGKPPPAEPPPEPPPDPAPPTARDPPAGRTGAAELDPAGPSLVDVKAIAMVLLVDRSGSMGVRLPNGIDKMSYAKTSANETAKALGPGDLVAVLTFGNRGAGRIELPLTPATDRQTIEQGIARLAAANEGTYALSALKMAEDLLAAAKAAVKHVVVISDGQIHDMPSVLNWVTTRGASPVTLSVISITDRDTDTVYLKLAEEVSQAGGGEFLATRDAEAVPVLVLAQVARSLDRVGRKPRGGGGSGAGPGQTPPPAPEPPRPEPKPEPRPEPKLEPKPEPAPAAARVVVRAVADSTLLHPPPAAAWPSLGGAVRSNAPLDAHVLLVAGDEGSPLLAFGNRGLGRAAAFAADLGGPDGAEFRADPAFPGRFAQWVAALLRPLPALPVRDCLVGPATVLPVAPTSTELEALAAAVGAPVEPLAQWTEPPARVEFCSAGQAVAWALAAIVALALLAAFEGFASRRWP